MSPPLRPTPRKKAIGLVRDIVVVMFWVWAIGHAVEVRSAFWFWLGNGVMFACLAYDMWLRWRLRRDHGELD